MLSIQLILFSIAAAPHPLMFVALFCLLFSVRMDLKLNEKVCRSVCHLTFLTLSWMQFVQ